ncbi:MAG TPA: VWA domain-containing protein [Terriglobales bacterium]|nr:VWA domain-containing protein [Terriglobales bacterium]
MAKRFLPIGFLAIFVLGFGSTSGSTQEYQPDIHVIVDMVQLNVAVTDNKGNYVTGLGPQDFLVNEDGIAERIATFGEGDEPTRRVVDVSPDNNTPGVVSGQKPGSLRTEPIADSPGSLNALIAGSNVFILFDTSNYMYRGFVFAQDAIADFVRSLQNADRVAFYSYSRDLSRSSSLTTDRGQVLRAVRSSVAGDDAALYNCLLLTVKDAATYRGRKVIVVFSNGPDNASVVPPEDVAELAQSTGTVIYMISTQQAQLDPVSTAVFDRMTAATGGKAYFAKNWREEKQAFTSIRDDLAHLYSLSYYPRFNPNRGWRSITVKLVGEKQKKYHIRTRNGYRPLPARFSAGNIPSQGGSQ